MQEAAEELQLKEGEPWNSTKAGLLLQKIAIGRIWFYTKEEQSVKRIQGRGYGKRMGIVMRRRKMKRFGN